MGWLSRLFGGGQPQPAPAPVAAGKTARATPAVAPAATPAAPAVAPEVAAAEVAAAASLPPLLCWLVDAPLSQPGLSAPEQQALDTIDSLLAQPALPPELLPRAANMVPQLIAMLRQQDLPIAALAERIGKDPTVAAEVLRMAGSAYYRSMGPVQDLQQAIQRLGVDGLQMAISRVVLRPMYHAQPGTLTAQVAPRLWEHADVLSRHCAQAARDQGLSAFDGYLAGLLHGTGWTVLFHALQRSGQASLGRFSPEASSALELRSHRLFGLAAKGWEITPVFSALAADARRVPLAHSSNPMAVALRAAQAPCLAELLATPETRA